MLRHSRNLLFIVLLAIALVSSNIHLALADEAEVDASGDVHVDDAPEVVDTSEAAAAEEAAREAAQTEREAAQKAAQAEEEAARKEATRQAELEAEAAAAQVRLSSRVL